LDQPMSIYRLPSATFRLSSDEVTGTTWFSEFAVKVLEETRYPSVASALRCTGVVVADAK
jgi:hypothetical protein